MKIKTYLYLACILLLLYSCTKRKSENITPQITNVVKLSRQDSLCVTQKNISYKLTVKPIIDANCYSCHIVDEVDLSNFANLYKYAKNGKLLGDIEFRKGYKSMPQNAPKMDTCSIYLIKTWIDEGALEN